MNRWEGYGNHESVHSGYLLKRKSELCLRLKSRTFDEKLTIFSWRGNKNRGRESSLVCGNLTINLEHPNQETKCSQIHLEFVESSVKRDRSGPVEAG